MSKKSAKIARLLAENGQSVETWDPHYTGYFICFNRQEFYEAHDVLEELWLAQRDGPNYGFYKGLIQLAGAFVHLQKQRLRPASALFRLCQTYLGRYPAFHDDLQVDQALEMAQRWDAWLAASDFTQNPLSIQPPPRLELQTNRGTPRG